MKLKTTVTAIAVHRQNENPIYGENVINIRLADEAAGFFVELEQDGSKKNLELGELELILKTASNMVFTAEGRQPCAIQEPWKIP